MNTRKHRFTPPAGIFAAWMAAGLLALPVPAFPALASGSAPAPRREIVIQPDSDRDCARTIGLALDTLRSLGGGTLRFRPGDYWIGSHDKAIILRGLSGIAFKGDEGAVIRQMPGTNASNFFYARDCSRLTFSGLWFRGAPLRSNGGDTLWHSAIQCEGAYADVIIEGCRFTGFRTGAVRLLGSARRSAIRDCAFVGVGNKYDSAAGDYGAVELDSPDDVSVIGNRFFDLTHSAVSFYRGRRLIISDNQAWFDLGSPFTMGIFGLMGLRESRIEGNRFEGVWNEGIDLRSRSGGFPIEKNVIRGNRIAARFAGVALNQGTCAGADSARDNDIYENDIGGVWVGGRLDSVDHGIYASSASRTRARGNAIRNFLYGINFQCCGTNDIGENRLERGGVAGIQLNGAGRLIGNRITGVPQAIVLGHSSGAVVRGNRLERTETRVYLSREAEKATVKGNCDDRGGCD
jgi:hypothetical protein